MKKSYIIVGNNNYWYSSFDAKNIKERNAELNQVADDIKNNRAENNDATKLYIYEVSARGIKTIEKQEDKD